MVARKVDKAARKVEREEKRAARRAAKRGSPTNADSSNEATVHLVLPASLTSRQRALVHAVADIHGLEHESTDQDGLRRLHIGKLSDAEEEMEDVALSDHALASLLHDRFSICLPLENDGSHHSSARLAGTITGPQHSLSLGDFVASCAGQLQLEQAAEIAQAETELEGLSANRAQASGRSLMPLFCTLVESGLFGKTMLTLSSAKPPGHKEPPPLPAHKLTPHDVIALRSINGAGAQAEHSAVSGVVYRVSDNSVIVAVDDIDEAVSLDNALRVDKLANKVTYERYAQVLKEMQRASVGTPDLPGGPLLDVAFGTRSPQFSAAPSLPPRWRAISGARLDASQRAAVMLALSAQDVALIHGPPGTGKTTALVEVILQEVARGSRVLCSAASNVATDNLAERVSTAEPRIRVVRVGHPARLNPAVLGCSLESHVMRSDASLLASDCRAECTALAATLLKLGPRERTKRREIRAEMRRLCKEERSRQNKAADEVLSRAQVVCCTLTGVHSRHLSGRIFDVACVDEAAQALEVAAWGALLRARRCLLAGDHLQLPPTVLSEEAVRNGLAVTLFERLHVLHGGGAAQMLTVQYRMHERIMAWSSGALYSGRLRADTSVAQHTLAGMLAARKGVLAEAGEEPSLGCGLDETAGDELEEIGMAVASLVLIDTAGCSMEEVEEEGGSRRNDGEASLAVRFVRLHTDLGLDKSEVGVITPYSAQTARLKAALLAEGLQGVEVSTVDGFQGREKELIIISMVRSNAQRQVGFLADRRRMNVAVTRARRRCILICNTETISADKFLAGLAEHFEANGLYRSAGEFDAG